MNKKDLLQALIAGLAFGGIVYGFMMVFIFFIEHEVNPDEIFNPQIQDINFDIDYKVLDDAEVHPLDSSLPQPQFEIRIQNRYDNELLEVTATVDDAIDYIIEYSRFHDDLFVYDLKTKELVADSATINETMRALKTEEQLLIDASQHPERFSDAEIFELLVD